MARAGSSETAADQASSGKAAVVHRMPAVSGQSCFRVDGGDAGHLSRGRCNVGHRCRGGNLFGRDGPWRLGLPVSCHRLRTIAQSVARPPLGGTGAQSGLSAWSLRPVRPLCHGWVGLVGGGAAHGDRWSSGWDGAASADPIAGNSAGFAGGLGSRPRP